MKSVSAIKTYLEKDAERIPTSELREFWDSLSEQEKREFAEQSARLLGVSLDAEGQEAA